MRGITLSRDSSTTLLIPDVTIDDGRRADWAAGEAATLAAEHDLDAGVQATLTEALIRAQRGAAEDIGVHALIYDPATQGWGTLHVAVVDRELTQDEQSAVLRPPALFEPRIRTVESPHLGVGCSSTAVLAADSAAVVWLFMSPGVSLVARLGLRSPRSTMPLAVIAEDVVLSVQVEGATAAGVPGFDPESLAAVTDDTSDRVWQV